MKNELAIYLFHQGTNFRCYEYFGAHVFSSGGKTGVVFRVWAPAAVSVSVIGDFNGWNVSSDVMKRIDKDGIYELFVTGAKVGDRYKYAVAGKAGVVEKADPFAFEAEKPPLTASVVCDVTGFEWTDGEFVKNRDVYGYHDKPVNIYELNLGSFRRKEDGGYYGYSDYARELPRYLKENGYNFVEFMPVTEYPFDGSWGYQVTGYYSVTSRFGTPEQFALLVDALHREGISVIIDWVPAHFPKDTFGLFEFDGGPLYEAHGWDRIEHKGWGTRRFDFGRTEIQSFLTSSASFFFDVYHIDGIRVDAVASMLYLDYDKRPGEWIPNVYGGNINLEAVAFLKKLNGAVKKTFPYALMIAEESTSYEGVTRPVEQGGLGFDYKWNMGWMNDALSYVATDPLFRRYDHRKLTFSLMYAFSEHFILPVSHDEVVHGKKSLIDKQFGSYEDKFSGNKAFMGYMMSHPGKKLVFMGAEFGQFKEWNYAEGLEFFLKKYPSHDSLSVFYRDLNRFYVSEPAMYGDDDGWDGFEWLAADDADENIVAYMRKYRGERLIAVINFGGIDRNYRLGMERGEYAVVFSSDKREYGGRGVSRKKIFKTERTPSHGKAYSIELKLAKLSFVYLKKR